MNQSTAFPAQALLLAAGRGERMRPLTDHTPKPLLAVRGKPLLRWHLEALARAGVRSVCINTAWLGEQISSHLGNAFTPGADAWSGPAACPAPRMALHYSHEGLDFGGALETAGGIARALPLLDEVFWVAAGDVYLPGFIFDPQARARFAGGTVLAHLWLVPNPEHHPQGDFGLDASGLALNLPAQHPGARHTYSTVGLYKRAFFSAALCGVAPGNPNGVKVALGPLLRQAMDRGLVSAELYTGAWADVGTPQRLAALNAGWSASAALR